MMEQPTAEKTVTVSDALMNARRLMDTHPSAAARQAQAIISVEPGIAESHLILAVAFRRLGRFDEAEVAEKKGIQLSLADEVLKRASMLHSSGRSGDAEQLVKLYLKDTPNDPVAVSLLADMAIKAGQLGHAEEMLWRVLGLTPSFRPAREQFYALLAAQARSLFRDTSKPPEPPGGEEEFAHAIELNEQAVGNHPEKPAVWLSYGHALRLAGRRDDSIAAYRKAVELRPEYGEAWWSLADLKTSALNSADIELMLEQLHSARGNQADRIGIHFALGRAFDDANEYELAFQHYDAGNTLKRKSFNYDVGNTIRHVEQCKAQFDSAFFANYSGDGHPADDPIFIIGMPRAGSTLVEQILATHPSIEGTEELVYFGNLAGFIADGRRVGDDPSDFAAIVSKMPADKLAAIGGAYLWHADKQRRSSRPRFIDKMPRNWLYLPLIRLALPNAKIIDVRRDAMDCCWSNFRQLFADSGEYSYSLTDLGQYYRAYVDMMSHFDAVDPGAVHRVNYEQLIEDPDGEVRRMLDYLGLPFDPACLEFHRNPRAVKTASSEQVRQPINRSGVDQWRPYQQWLAPLEQSLGSLADR